MDKTVIHIIGVNDDVTRHLTELQTEYQFDLQICHTYYKITGASTEVYTWLTLMYDCQRQLTLGQSLYESVIMMRHCYPVDPLYSQSK